MLAAFKFAEHLGFFHFVHSVFCNLQKVFCLIRAFICKHICPYFMHLSCYNELCFLKVTWFMPLSTNFYVMQQIWCVHPNFMYLGQKRCNKKGFLKYCSPLAKVLTSCLTARLQRFMGLKTEPKIVGLRMHRTAN